MYNALKTMRWNGVHDVIWKDAEVKNVHYILSPKPWEEDPEGRDQDQEQDGVETRDGNSDTKDPLYDLWWKVNGGRLREEKRRGINDRF